MRCAIHLPLRKGRAFWHFFCNRPRHAFRSEEKFHTSSHAFFHAFQLSSECTSLMASGSSALLLSGLSEARTLFVGKIALDTNADLNSDDFQGTRALKGRATLFHVRSHGPALSSTQASWCRYLSAVQRSQSKGVWLHHHKCRLIDQGFRVGLLCPRPGLIRNAWVTAGTSRDVKYPQLKLEACI